MQFTSGDGGLEELGWMELESVRLGVALVGDGG